MTTWFFALLGVAVGVVHAGLLARFAHGKPRPLRTLARLAIVVVAVVLAARAGHLVACASAWFLTFTAAAFVLQRRLR